VSDADQNFGGRAIPAASGADLLVSGTSDGSDVRAAGHRTRSSDLIRQAVAIVVCQWGTDRCYTLVDPAKVRSANPGFCFKSAGWTNAGHSKGGKVILEIFPQRDE